MRNQAVCVILSVGRRVKKKQSIDFSLYSEFDLEQVFFLSPSVS